jgi:hypothetical protein
MNRIRHAYVEASPAIERHLVTSPYDDDRGLYRTYAADPPATQHIHALFTTPGMVSVINAVIAAVIVGIAAQALNLGTALPAVLSVAAFAGAFAVQWRYQIRVLAGGTGLAPEFPHPGQSQSRPNHQPHPQRR